MSLPTHGSRLTKQRRDLLVFVFAQLLLCRGKSLTYVGLTPGQLHRCKAISVGLVNVCTGLEKQGDACIVSLQSSRTKGGCPLFLRMKSVVMFFVARQVHIGPRIQEDGDNRRVSVGSCEDQSGLVVLFIPMVDIRSRLDQCLRSRRLTFQSGHFQRSVTRVFPNGFFVHINPRLQ